LGGYQVSVFHGSDCNECCLLGCENYQICVGVCCVYLQLIHWSSLVPDCLVSYPRRWYFSQLESCMLCCIIQSSQWHSLYFFKLPFSLFVKLDEWLMLCVKKSLYWHKLSGSDTWFWRCTYPWLQAGLLNLWKVLKNETFLPVFESLFVLNS
jgi:hypothetical protein